VEPLEAEEIPEGSIGARFLTDTKDLAAVSRWLKDAGWQIVASEMRYLAKNPVELGDAARQEVAEFLNALDDHDDVHRVYAALK
jgi:transcriptional/translational regulatory protein YebC/TACO1